MLLPRCGERKLEPVGPVRGSKRGIAGPFPKPLESSHRRSLAPAEALVDYGEGPKKDVAEIKFLIHDLRVEWFFSEVIHYHVSLNADLEIYGVDQAQVLHRADLDELRDQAASVRRSFRAYSKAVTSRAPDRTVLTAGERLVQAAYEMCELVLNPLWGRSDRVLSFLPPESRSVRSRSHYMNCIRWICGVHYRIRPLPGRDGGADPYEDFDVAEEHPGISPET